VALGNVGPPIKMFQINVIRLHQIVTENEGQFY